MSMDRQCSSGLMTIATAAKQVIVDRMDIIVAGGQESISLVQTKEMRVARPRLIAMHPNVYMPMLQTAEVVAKRYNISRDAMDEYALQSQQRTAAAQAAGKFDAEIVARHATMGVADKETGEVTFQEVTMPRTKATAPKPQLEGLQALKPVIDGGMTSPPATPASFPTARQPWWSWKPSRCRKAGLTPLGRYVGMAVAGTEPDEMGIGPVLRGAQAAGSALASRSTISACGN
jgi:acetyl-CoA C-acetyltransferase